MTHVGWIRDVLFWQCQLKEKIHNLKVESYSVRSFRTSSLGGSNSNNPERIALRRQGGVLQQRAGSQNIKSLLVIKENQISQVKEFSALLYMGRCKSLGQIKSFF